jgi:hypothetical protein
VGRNKRKPTFTTVYNRKRHRKIGILISACQLFREKRKYRQGNLSFSPVVLAVELLLYSTINSERFASRMK